MTGLYSKVEGGVVKDGPRDLPESQKIDGLWVTGLQHLPLEKLKECGWYRYVVPTPEFDEETHELVLLNNELTIDDDLGVVSPNYSIVEKVKPSSDQTSIFNTQALALSKLEAKEAGSI